MLYNNQIPLIDPFFAEKGFHTFSIAFAIRELWQSRRESVSFKTAFFSSRITREFTCQAPLHLVHAWLRHGACGRNPFVKPMCVHSVIKLAAGQIKRKQGFVCAWFYLVSPMQALQWSQFLQISVASLSVWFTFVESVCTCTKPLNIFRVCD